jgi:HlyD family secretion protein
MRRVLMGAAVAAGVAGAAWFGLAQSASRAVSDPSWRTVAVERGSIVAAVNATGTVNPTATAIVGTQVSGQVVEIRVDFNSAVKAGDVLARLNTEQISAKYDAAKADLAQSVALNQIQMSQIEKVRADVERSSATRADAVANGRKAEALLADARLTLDRQEQLRSRGIASEVTLQSARTLAATQSAALDQANAQVRSVDAQIQALAADLKVAQTQVLSSSAQIAQREAMMRQIEVDLRNSEIRSPVEGIVIQRNVELGQTVAASLQTPTLFLVAQDLTKIEIYANVDEADVGRVQGGQDVTFTVTAFPSREFSGKVKAVRLGSQTIQNVVIYTAVIEVANADMALKPGMTATLRIFTERRSDVLKLSNAALRWRPPGESAVVAAQPQAPSNPFAPVAQAGPPGPGGGQNFQRQMLERLSAELKLDDAQKRQLDDISREVRTSVQAANTADTPAARRERAQAVAAGIAERLKPLLRPDQMERFAVWQAERAERRAGNQGVPGRVYVVGGDGQPQLTQVRLGASDGNFTEVLSGLTEGQKAIIGGRAAAGKSAAASGAPRPPGPF